MLNSKWMKRAAMLSLSLVLLFACAVTAFAAEPSKLPLTNYGEIRIVDDAGLLTGSEKDELTAYGRQIAQETGFIVFVKTTFDTDGKEVRRYLADEYEQLGYNDSLPAIMLCIDMGGRNLAVLTTEAYTDYFPVKKTDAMVDDVAPYLTNGDYAGGIRYFLDEAEETIVNYGVKPVGTIVLVSFVSGLVLAALVVGGMIYLHPRISSSKISATAYLQGGRVQMHRQEDRFAHTFTTSRRIPKNNSSGGGVSSSSGGRYSGSSGKF